MTTWADAFRDAKAREEHALNDRDTALRLRCPWHHPNGGWPCTADATPEHEHRYDPNDLPWMENRP